MAYDYIVKVGADVGDIAKDIMSALGGIDKDAKIKVKCDDSDIKRVVKAMSSVDKIAAKRITLDVKGDGVYKTLAEIRKETQETVDSMKKEFDAFDNVDFDKNINNLISQKNNLLNNSNKTLSKKELATYIKKKYAGLKDLSPSDYKNEANSLMSYMYTYINGKNDKGRYFDGDLYDISSEIGDFYSKNLKKLNFEKKDSIFKNDNLEQIQNIDKQIKELQKQQEKYISLKKELEEYKALGIVPGGNFGSDDYTGTGSGSGNGSGSGIENAEKLAEILEQIKKTLGSIDGESGLKDVLVCINEISVSLESMRKVVSDVGEGQKLSPLLSALDELKNGISLNSFGEESGIKGFSENIESIKESFLAVKNIIADVGDGSELSPLLSKIQEISDAINKLAEATNVYGKFAARYYLDKVDETKNNQNSKQNNKNSQTSNGSSSGGSGANGTTAADKAKAIKEETQKILDAVEAENQKTKDIVGHFDSEYDDNTKKFNNTLTGTSISTKRDIGNATEHTKYTVGYNSSEDKVVIKKDVRADYVEKEKEAQKELNSLMDEYIKKQRIINSASGSSGVDVDKLQSELNDLEQNLFEKVLDYQTNGIITEESSFSFFDNFYKTVNENNKKDIYTSLIADTQEYIKWLKAETTATGKAKDEAAAHVQALENSIAAKKGFIEQVGLNDEESDIKIQKMNDKATEEIDFKKTGIVNKEELKEINILLDDYIEKSSILNKAENATNKIDTDSLASSKLEALSKLANKIQEDLAKCVITEDQANQILEIASKRINETLQRDTYESLNKDVSEYIKRLKEEEKLTGDEKEAVTAIREGLEQQMQAKRDMLSTNGLLDLKKELEIDEKILQTNKEINLERIKKNSKDVKDAALEARKAALEEINKLLDDYIEKSDKVTSVENAFSSAGDKINKGDLKSSRNKSRKKLNKKLNKRLQDGIITQEDYDSIVNKKNNQENSNLQKNTYSAINSKIQEYISLLKEEESATGDVKEKVTNLRKEIETYIQDKRKMLENRGLSDLEEELKIDEKILKAQREIDLEKTKNKNKQNKQSEKDLSEFVGRSYDRQTKLVKEKNKLELKNISASEPEKAANNVRIEAIKKQIQLEEEYRNALNLSNANDEARTRLLNTQIKARNELNTEEKAYAEKLKKEDEITKKKESEKKAKAEMQNSKYNSEDVEILQGLLDNTVLDDGSGGNAAFSKISKFDSSGKGTIVFVEELDGKIRETTVHVEDLNDALDRIKDNKFSSTGLKTDFKEKDIKEPESNVSSKKVQKDVLSLKSSFTNAFKGDDFALQTFMSIIERIRTEYKELSDMKLNGLMDEDELSNFKELEKYLNSLVSVLKKNTLGKFNADDFVPDVQGDFAKAERSFKEIAGIFTQIQNGELVSDEDISRIKTFATEARNLYKNMNNEENILAKDGSVNKLKKRISTALNENTKHTPEMNKFREDLKNLQKEVAEGMPLTKFKKDGATLEKILAGIEESGDGGLSIIDRVFGKIRDISSSFIAQYFSFQDIVRYIRTGLTTIRELDTAFTEMRKVSNESVDSLRKFQKESFTTASAVGTTAQQIQNSTADWMRLGESLEEAKDSAATSNILLNVSEFESIDEATESLVAMSSAYDELTKTQIVDKLNNVGNNFSISTDGLATALQKSASALKTAGNDMDEAIALVTAGNAVVQDPDSVGAGLRTISLRLVGTEAAKEELETLGEDTSDFVVQTSAKSQQAVKDFTRVASNDFKGFDILDDNGNFKSTYEIMLGLSKIYAEIVETDKKYGSNMANGLLETIAGIMICQKNMETYFYRTHLIARTA